MEACFFLDLAETASFAGAVSRGCGASVGATVAEGSDCSEGAGVAVSHGGVPCGAAGRAGAAGAATGRGGTGVRDAAGAGRGGIAEACEGFAEGGWVPENVGCTGAAAGADGDETGAAGTGRTEATGAEETGDEDAGAGLAGAGGAAGADGAGAAGVPEAGATVVRERVSNDTRRGSRARFRSNSSSAAEGSRLVSTCRWLSSTICHAAWIYAGSNCGARSSRRCFSASGMSSAAVAAAPAWRML